MKKFFRAILTLILMMPLAALAEAPHHPLDVHLSETYTEDLPGLLERKYIRVLTTMNRTNFFLAGGTAHGFEYALLKEYEKFLNQKITSRELKITLEFIPVGRDELLSGLVQGRGDIAAAGLTITDQREKIVDFTRPYLTGVDEVLVTHRKTGAPESPSGLSGQRVFVRPSSSYFESLQRLNRQLKKDGRTGVRIVPADENLETEDILELVNSGAIARTICDSHIAEIWSKVLPHIRVHEDVALRQDGRIAWAVRKDAPRLKASLNRFLQNHRKGTLLGNIFFQRYYEKTQWVKNPLGQADLRKIKKYRPYFEKYADRYGFDWRLLLAMAYQESGLDPDTISHRGAIGLMQILPSTAADPNVGIPRIDRLENNIHAAVKYLDFIRDRYFSEPNISPRNRVRFALAAYNAGPAKIRRARNKAKAMNLDPDRWFRNVELAVLRLVGQETVRYVSNINKYYVIYKNALERADVREEVMDDLM